MWAYSVICTLQTPDVSDIFLVSILHDLQWPEGLGRWAIAAGNSAPISDLIGNCLKYNGLWTK